MFQVVAMEKGRGRVRDCGGGLKWAFGGGGQLERQVAVWILAITMVRLWDQDRLRRFVSPMTV